MIIACDVDDTVANLLPTWLAQYNKDYDDDLKPSDIKSWAVSDYVRPMCGLKIYDYLTADLYDDVQRIEGAWDGVRKLREMGHRVVFVTSTPKGCEGARLKWLLKYGFLTGDERLFDDYVECHDKSLIHADLMIDDRAHNLKGFKGRHKLLFAQQHNEKERSLYTTCATWKEVVAWVETLTANDVADKKRQEAYGPSFFVPTFTSTPIGNHPTEVKSPNQAKRFREIVDEMYKVHLDKNADYSPANIMGVGELGLATRIWDKTTRLMNLLGFDIRAELITYTGPKIAKNESIEDTYRDLSVYAIIGRLLREGKWGN